jgi:hypothetical protein
MRTEEDFAADNRRKLRTVALIAVPCGLCLVTSLVLGVVVGPPPPPPPPASLPDAATLPMESADAEGSTAHAETLDANHEAAAVPVDAPAAADATERPDTIENISTGPDASADLAAHVADVIARVNAKLAEPYDPAQAIAYDNALIVLEGEVSNLTTSDRAARRDLHRAQTALARKRRSIHRDVLEREGEALARETCGASPPDLADDNGRRMFQRGFFIEHRDDPGEELLRCGPMTLAPLTCWRIACVTSGMRSVEFFWRRGTWTSMRYLR